MEKHQQDPLDDYVRQSFDDFEAPPSSNMWSRVSDALDNADKKDRVLLPWWSQYSIWSRAAVAAGILLTVAVLGQYMSYKEPQQPAQVQRNTLQPTAPAPRLEVVEQQPSNIAPPPSVLQEMAQTIGRDVPNIPKQILPKSSGAEQDNRLIFDVPIRVPNTSTVERPVDPVVLQRNPAPATDTVVGHTSELAVTTPQLPVTNYPLIGTLPLLPIKTKNITPVFEHFTQKHEPFSRNNWYVSLQVAPVRMNERQRSNSAIARRWASSSERTAPSTDVWLRVGRSFSPHWGWESGLGYRSISRTAVHAPRFRFREGIARPGSEGYDFKYGLDTYGGSTDVTLRMEQIDNSVMLPDNEAVTARVRTTERTHLLRVPVLLTFKTGRTRLSGVFKAGLNGNYIVQNSVTIEQRESTSNRFRVGQTVTLSPSKSKPFFVGYQVSGGLNYQLSNRISLLAEPTFSGDFGRKSVQKTALPAIVAVGLNIGVRVSCF